ncbi:unnamed protein product [Urochloa humidicola]
MCSCYFTSCPLCSVGATFGIRCSASWRLASSRLHTWSNRTPRAHRRLCLHLRLGLLAPRPLMLLRLLPMMPPLRGMATVSTLLDERSGHHAITPISSGFSCHQWPSSPAKAWFLLSPMGALSMEDADCFAGDMAFEVAEGYRCLTIAGATKDASRICTPPRLRVAHEYCRCGTLNMYFVHGGLDD